MATPAVKTAARTQKKLFCLTVLSPGDDALKCPAHKSGRAQGYDLSREQIYSMRLAARNAVLAMISTPA